jgi:hypothetical protein
MTTSTAVEPAANDPQARAGYGIRATFKRDGIRTVGWYGFDPPKALCSCGAESGLLRTSSAAKAWLTDHSHDTDGETP